ncbi:MAG TPA: hypothetical protein VH255_02040 [Verrucomicrobiae bacterium]|nr:hypothetical protein [Verrucomicrobiae bacterium]
MKTKILFSAIALMAGSLIAADAPADTKADPKAKDEVTAAAKALMGKNNYSWTTTVVVPAGSRFRPGPTTGQTEKDGYTHVAMSFGGNSTEMIIKGTNAAVSSPDGGWQSLADLDADQGGPGRFMGAMARDFKAPAAQVGDLITGATAITKDGDAYSSDLAESEVKTLLSFRIGGGASANVSDAKGTVKFWITDGVLSKYETHVTGKVSFNGNDREVDRDSTVEIKDVNSTKVTVPDDAQKKMNPAPVATDSKTTKM